MTQTVPASSLVVTIAANVDNDKLSDKEFREFVGATLDLAPEVIDWKRRVNRMIVNIPACDDPNRIKNFEYFLRGFFSDYTVKVAIDPSIDIPRVSVSGEKVDPKWIDWIKSHVIKQHENIVRDI